MNRVVFVFPGQGAQWRGMGSALLEREPVFAEAVRDCERAFAPYLDWSLTDVLSGNVDVDRIDVVQPALFALQVGLARLWESRGIVPAAMVGHSLGEVAAAHAAGALTLDQAAQVVRVRSGLYRRLSGSGAMALVGLGWSQAATVVAEQNGRVCLAATNAPGSTVVAGDHDAVHALVEQLRWEDVFCRLIGADVAGHSHHVDPLLPELRAALAALRPGIPHTPLWSTVTARPGAPLDADYWCRNLREPVLFWPVIRELLDAGHDTFVELSPHPTLLSGLRDTSARLLPSMLKESMLKESMLKESVHKESVHKEDEGVFADSLAELRAVELSAAGVLGDHRVEGQALFPGAGYLAVALAGSDGLADVGFHTPLVLDAPCRLRTALTGDEISLTCGGVVHATALRAAAAPAARVDLALVRARCATPVDSAGLYADFAARGMEYGPAFQGVEAVFVGRGESLARLRPAAPAGPYRVDVALLDACLQAVAPLLAAGEDLLLPRGVGEVSLLGEAGAARWAHVRELQDSGEDAAFDIDVCDDDGRVTLALRRVLLRRIARGAEPGGWTYTTEWLPVEPGEGLPFEGVVHHVRPGHPAEEAVPDLLRLAKELAALPEPPRLWVVTRGAQQVETGEQVDPDASAVWGMARTIRHEHSELSCTLIDLAGEALPETWQLGEENEVAYRGDRPFALRLVPRRAPRADGEPYRVVQPVQEDLGALTLHADAVRPPGPGEVQILVRAAGLNFNDVLRAAGMLGEQEEPLGFGLECAGEVSAVGEGVTGLSAGSRVVALVAEIGSMASHVTVDARLAAPIPDDLGFTAAATLPAAYVTAVYGMDRLAGLRRDERVLVHAAAGGVGQAAVLLARRAGAEVLATAGSHRKREWLRAQGVRHVFDSRSTAFADEVMAATGGAGVDMVVNCLTGKAVDEGLRVLAHFGRFVELGKRDIAENRPLPLGHFAKSLSFHAVEAFSLARLRPEAVGAILGEVVAAVADGGLRPLPVIAFPASEASAAFRHMASAKHIGKIVLTFDGSRLRADGTYLVTGGLSGLGLAAAEQLVRQGARHLGLLGRGGPGPAAADRVAALREAGVQVTVLAADVADNEALAAALDGLRAQSPPIRGVVHAAGVLRDRVLTATDPDAVLEVLRPKVAGTRNLHRLTAQDPVELFVLFSSAAGLLGSAGQAGYAAANAFLDGFARWRRAQGLPATSIDWGPWSETGLAATADRAGRLAVRGMGGIDTVAGLAAFAAVLAEQPAQIAIISLDPPTWFAHNPGQDRWSIFAGLRGEPAPADRLEISTPEELKRAMTAWVAGVLRTSPAAIDPQISLTRLGLDSLMAIELRNLVESRLGVRLPTPAFLDGPTVTELTERVLLRLGDRTADDTEVHDPMVARLDALSDAQVDALLDELLNDPIGGVA